MWEEIRGWEVWIITLFSFIIFPLSSFFLGLFPPSSIFLPSSPSSFSVLEFRYGCVDCLEMHSVCQKTLDKLTLELRAVAKRYIFTKHTYKMAVEAHRYNQGFLSVMPQSLMFPIKLCSLNHKKPRLVVHPVGIDGERFYSLALGLVLEGLAVVTEDETKISKVVNEKLFGANNPITVKNMLKVSLSICMIHTYTHSRLTNTTRNRQIRMSEIQLGYKRDRGGYTNHTRHTHVQARRITYT